MILILKISFIIKKHSSIISSALLNDRRLIYVQGAIILVLALSEVLTYGSRNTLHRTSLIDIHNLLSNIGGSSMILLMHFRCLQSSL